MKHVKLFEHFVNEANTQSWYYIDKNTLGKNVTKFVRAAGENDLGKYVERVDDRKVIITKPSDKKDADLLMDIIDFALGRHNIELNEMRAPLIKQKLSKDGELFTSWFNKIMKSGTVKSIEFDKNSIEVAFETNTDLSSDIFNMVREWPTAPSQLGLYIDVMSVNRGQLVMVIFANPGISFTV
jgi:hypothetical protein